MNEQNNSMMVCARGLGKTYLTALFCVVRCILYPGTTITCASNTRRQATLILSKIQDQFMPKSDNLRAEISDVQLGQYNTVIKFHNTSKIVVVSCNQNARGERSNILLIDEFRMCDKNIIDTVLKKFLTAPRTCGFMDLPEYAGEYTPEENKEIYLSSAWYAGSWAHKLFLSYASNMVFGKSYMCCAFPYQLSIKEGLLTRTRVETEMSDPTFNEITWSMEMESQFWAGSEESLYQFDEIDPCRKLALPFYPPSLTARIPDKRLKIPPKLHNEARILSADIALMASTTKKSNDATSIFVTRVLMNDAGGRSQKQVVYTTNEEGLRTEEYALTIRRLAYDFDCDWLAIDARTIGIPIMDALMADMYDPTRGVTYPALNCANNDDFARRCKVPGAPKKIWAMIGSADLNSQCALTLREEFRQGNIQLLQSEENFDEIFSQINGFDRLSSEDKLSLKMPYIHTTLAVNELINLETEIRGNYVRMKEKRSARKDRYSSLSYNIWLANYLEREHKTRDQAAEGNTIWLQFRQPVISRRR